MVISVVSEAEATRMTTARMTMVMIVGMVNDNDDDDDDEDDANDNDGSDNTFYLYSCTVCLWCVRPAWHQR